MRKQCKVEIKTQKKTNLVQKNDGEERREEYPTSSDLRLLLSLFSSIFLYQISLLCFHLYVVFVLLSAPSLHTMNLFTENFLLALLLFIVAMYGSQQYVL